MGKTVTSNLIGDGVMSVVEAAYFAGFLDGEGTLTILRQERSMNRCGHHYRALMNIANTDRAVLEWLRSACGNGTIVSNFHKPMKMFHRTVFVLRFNQGQIRHVLPQLVPYLLAKLQQARLLLQYFAHSDAYPWHQRSDEEWKEIERLRNVRGGHKKPTFRSVESRPSRLGSNQFMKQFV